MKQFDQVTAIYSPRWPESLRAGLSEQIGREFVFEALWLITPDDNELYAGEWAMVALTNRQSMPWWIPSGDLDIRQAQSQLGHASVTMTEAYVRARKGSKVTPTK